MKQMKRLLGVGLLVLLCAGLGLAQPEVGIVVEAWSPQEIHDLGWESHPSTGLTTVGVGELVYLFAEADTVVAVAWSITTAPTGSAAVLDSTDTQRTTFRPDIVGDYVVQASITTDTGTADATVTITASTYVGVGIWTELQGNPGGSSCSPCHTGNVSQWLETGHPTIFKDGIDGIASSHYSEACIECHTLGYNTEPEAINNGFDDIATDLGWQFPDVLQVGNWDSLVTNFPDLAVMGSIQCENCHGPASEHTIGFDAAKMDVTLDEGMCGRCHEEEPYHRKNTQWKRSGHSAGDVAFGAGRADCAPCHSGYGFVNRIDPDMPFDEGLGFPYISCAVCHDPHSAGLAAQVRTLDNVVLNNGETITFGGMGKLCMSCHLSRRDAETYTDEYHDHYGPHHSTQADVLAGTNAITFGMYIPSTNHKGVIANACVDCHMAPTPATGEPGRDWLGEHAFAMTWDAGTPEDETDDVEHVAGCQSCHGAISSFDDIMAKVDYDQDGTIEAARAELLGLLDEVGKLLPPLGDPHVEVVPEDYDPTEAGLTAEEVAQRQLYLKAAYNYFVVEEDGSHGLHNYQYAIHLLLAAHQALTTGSVAAGDILAIEDVPNDQGKQVRVQWTRFGADGAGQNPIVHYALWRRVDAANSTSATTVKGAAQVHMVAGDVQKLQTGSQLQFDGQLWDFAGTVPAAGLENYSAIAPTIFDSTIVSGMAYSVFMVTGHTAIPAVYAVSEPDSGYSVDKPSIRISTTLVCIAARRPASIRAPLSRSQR